MSTLESKGYNLCGVDTELFLTEGSTEGAA